MRSRCALLLLLSTIPLLADVRPVDLKCEYRVNPLGIDVASPRLSWILLSSDRKARGVKQSAFRLLVASDSKKLAKEDGDLWDTGKVESSQSIQVAYAGKALASGTQAFWKVQIWDGGGKKSAWSAPAAWSEGLLNAEDWTAKWIGHDETELYKDLQSPFRYLQNARWIWTSGEGPQTFHTKIRIPDERPVKRATVVMAADSGFELILNGESVGRGSTVRAPEIWDVTRLLKSGENSVQVKAEPSKQFSGLIGTFHIEFERSAVLEVMTDAAWSAEGAAVKELGSYGASPWGEIGYSEARTLPARMLRKEFETARMIKGATAYVSGLGLYELYVNGAKVGDEVLSPNLTDYDKRVHYVTFDVTGRLNSGKNAVGLILGNGRYWAPREKVPIGMRSFGYPKARVQIEIEYGNGETARVVSDESWKLTTAGPIRANNEYDGEEYDAGAELSGWAEPGFDDSTWQNADLVEGPAGKMVAQNAEPLRVTETIKPVKVSELRPGVYVFDMGQNMVGWCRLHVTGPKGTEVQLRHAETLQDNGELYTANLRSARATDTYKLKGDGPEVWEPRFTYHGFRYVEMQGAPGSALQQLRSKGEWYTMRWRRQASFSSSNELLNQIHSNVFWGVRGNYRSIPTDCPQRDERQGWLGDRSVVSRSESYLFDVAAFYTKWERDLADSQNADGGIPDVSPAYWTLFNDDITWPSTFIQVPSMLYDQYADLRVIQENYAPMKKWIDHMRGFLQAGLIPKDTYGDWCVPPEDPKLIHSLDPARKTDGTLLATAYFYWMNRQMARFARLIGKESDASEYDSTAEEIKTAFNKKFFNPDMGAYGNNTQTANIVPLAFGLAPPESKQKVFDALISKIETESKGHVGTGLVGAQWLMRTLSENGRPDVALQIATQPTYPGWGYMVKKGATTIWELWNGDTADPAMNSGNHVMQIGDLGLWMYEDLGGIRPDPEIPGFKHIRIHPYTVKGLSFVKTSHKSMYGLISSDWKRENGKLTLDVVIPPNTSATVWVPSKKASDVTEKGASADKARGVKFARMDEDAAVFDVESGSYSFGAPASE